MPLLLPCIAANWRRRRHLESYPWRGFLPHRAIARLAVLDSAAAESGPGRFTARPTSSCKALPGLFALRPCVPGPSSPWFPATDHVSGASGDLFDEARRLPGGVFTQRGAWHTATARWNQLLAWPAMLRGSRPLSRHMYPIREVGGMNQSSALRARFGIGVGPDFESIIWNNGNDGGLPPTSQAPRVPKALAFVQRRLKDRRCG